MVDRFDDAQRENLAMLQDRKRIPKRNGSNSTIYIIIENFHSPLASTRATDNPRPAVEA